jgi:deazaflavin-dependent oxidoreductase (nitroreductase family)
MDTTDLLRQTAKVTAPLARPLAGRRWFPLWAILVHRGRRSGRTYELPVVARRVNGGFIVPLPFGPETQWARNVEAAGGCVIRWAGREWPVGQPRVLDGAQASSAFSGVQRRVMSWSGLDRFLALTDAPAQPL